MANPTEPRAMAGGIPVYCAFDEIVPAAALVPNPRNPNQHPDEQIKLLAQIIAAQGWRAPVTVSRRSGFIVRGHGRLQTDRINQAGEIPVEYQDYASEAEEWADLIADNRLAELSEIDDATLGELLRDIGETDLPIELTGYSADEREDILAQIDAATAEPDDFDLDAALDEAAVPITRPGDIYVLDDRHRVMCGDSTNHEDVQRLMDGELAWLCLTDPPYNVDYGEKNEYLNLFDKGNRYTGAIENDKKSAGDFEQFLSSALSNMALVSSPGAAVYVFHPDSHGLLFRKSFETSGFILKQCLVWVKNIFVLGRQDYQWKHEPVLYGWKPGAAHYFTDERIHSTVLEDPPPRVEDMAFEDLLAYVEEMQAALAQFSSVREADKPTRSEDHPTMKPIPLIAPLIKNSSKPGWLVLDLFGGSGSTLVACEQLGRKCCTMECDPRNCDVIVRRYLRWKGSQGQPADIALYREGEEIPCPLGGGAS